MASTAPVADAPRVAGDPSFGGLVQIGETLVGALKRLESRGDYQRLIASDNGQRLLEAVNTIARDARAGRARKPAPTLTAIEAPEQAAREAEAAAVPAPALATQLLDLPIDLVDIAENVRTDPGDLSGLVASIRESGIQSPIRAVGPGPDGRYRAVNGQRRILATREAGLPTIRAMVETSSEDDRPGARRSIAQLAENLIRKAMNPIEEALAIRAVLEADPTLTQGGLAAKLGIAGATLSNALRLLELAAPVQDLVRTGELSQSHAKAVLSLDTDLQPAFAAKALASHWTSSQTEANAKFERQDADRTRATNGRATAMFGPLVESLEKVAQRDAVTLYADDHYGPGVELARLLRADGWTVVRATYQKGEAVKTACCPGAWRIEIPYSEAAGVAQLRPACQESAHREAREKARNAEWAKQRKADEANRAAAHKVELARTARLAERLVADPLGPLSLRLAIYAFATSEKDEDVAAVLGIVESDETLDALQSEVDVAWAALEAMPDDQLALALARMVALSLDDHWRVGEGAKAAIAELIGPDPAPEPAPAKPAKGKAKKAAAS